MFESVREVGTNHLKLVMRTATGRLDAIGFGMWSRFEGRGLEEGRWDALFRLERNEWRGQVSAQAKLIDLRPSA